MGSVWEGGWSQLLESLKAWFRFLSWLLSRVWHSNCPTDLTVVHHCLQPHIRHNRYMAPCKNAVHCAVSLLLECHANIIMCWRRRDDGSGQPTRSTLYGTVLINDLFGLILVLPNDDRRAKIEPIGESVTTHVLASSWWPETHRIGRWNQ